jgi:hypothetical protein
LPNSAKPFTSRIVLSLMDRIELSVSGVDSYHKKWTIENAKQALLLLVELAIQKQ